MPKSCLSFCRPVSLSHPLCYCWSSHYFCVCFGCRKSALHTAIVILSLVPSCLLLLHHHVCCQPLFFLSLYILVVSFLRSRPFRQGWGGLDSPTLIDPRRPTWYSHCNRTGVNHSAYESHVNQVVSIFQLFREDFVNSFSVDVIFDKPLC